MITAWNDLVYWIKRNRPAWTRGPYITSATHALVSVLGVQPWLWPGPVGILLWTYTGTPLLWLVASTWTCGWYWVREYKQNGITVKSRARGDGSRRTFGQRYDAVFDVVFPTIAVALQWWVLT